MQTQTIPTIVEDAIQSFGNDVDMDQNAVNAKPHIEEKMACECHIDVSGSSQSADIYREGNCRIRSKTLHAFVMAVAIVGIIYGALLL
jgi:hypothetical protein